MITNINYFQTMSTCPNLGHEKPIVEAKQLYKEFVRTSKKRTKREQNLMGRVCIPTTKTGMFFKSLGLFTHKKR